MWDKRDKVKWLFVCVEITIYAHLAAASAASAVAAAASAVAAAAAAAASAVAAAAAAAAAAFLLIDLFVRERMSKKVFILTKVVLLFVLTSEA